MANHSQVTLEDALSEEERELLRQLIGALRGLRYGSLLLTVHDGKLVEIQKTEKIRTKSVQAPASRKASSPSRGGVETKE